ncbi:heat shock factor protein HSF8-like [Diospyros lotus]|uniref:heat shock factor protein HSF8-like n=1 Tax=Diospyros lotus TaxID=55363 RepID=UPI00225BDFD4|nr:heat shock factor protein HSF8-like [Diospyros lotus]
MEAVNGGTTAANGGAAMHPQNPMPISSANAPPPFLVKTYDMVDDPSTDKTVSWSRTNDSFVIWDPCRFTWDLLPKYFNHSNFSRFVGQLNTCGFRKVDPDRWEFANGGFLRGQKHLLISINCQEPSHGHTNQQQQQPHGQSSSVGACVEVGKFGLEEEVERLNRDKNVLMQELVRLRQQQQTTDHQLPAMVQRLQGMEQRQQQMMSFLAKAMQSPGFLAQFVQLQNDSSGLITEGSKKRRLKQDGILDNPSVSPADEQIVKCQPMMNEAGKAMLRQIIKLGDSTHLENFSNNSDALLISDVSSPSTLDHGNSSTCTSGVTLQEVPPSSGQSFMLATSGFPGQRPSAAISEILSSPLGANSDMFTATPLSTLSPLGEAQEMPPVSLPQTDLVILELSSLQQMVPEGNIVTSGESFIGPETGSGVFINSNSLGNNGEMPLEIDNFSIDLEFEWDNSLLEDDAQKLPGIGYPCWEQILALSPQSLETEAHNLWSPQSLDSASLEPPTNSSEGKPLENGWNKTQHMEQLTEQMGLLTSDAKKV